jgi:hypothetical protein
VRYGHLPLSISREAGAGVVTVAELVRQGLTAAETEPSSSPWAVFDANLAKQVLKDHQLPPDLARFFGRGRSASSGCDCRRNSRASSAGLDACAADDSNDSASGWLRPLHQAFAERKGSLKVSVE